MVRIRKIFDTYTIKTDWSSWATALSMSILTFLISGFFLHGIFFRYIWVLIGLAMSAIPISNNTNASNQTIQMIEKSLDGEQIK